MKECPKCFKQHEKQGVYCSRTCANSRAWSKEDKIKKSNSALNSEKVKLANKNEEKRNLLSIIAKKQFLDGKTNWGKLHTVETIQKVKDVIKLKNKHWLSSLNIKDKVDYRKLCQFRFSLNSFPDEFDFNLIGEYGWYMAKNKGDNPNGISRDHMYSIHEGFKNNIDPYLISHPSNCQLMRHGDNNKKDRKSSITIEDLKERVRVWDEKYGVIV